MALSFPCGAAAPPESDAWSVAGTTKRSWPALSAASGAYTRETAPTMRSVLQHKVGKTHATHCDIFNMQAPEGRIHSPCRSQPTSREAQRRSRVDGSRALCVGPEGVDTWSWGASRSPRPCLSLYDAAKASRRSPTCRNNERTSRFGFGAPNSEPRRARCWVTHRLGPGPDRHHHRMLGLLNFPVRVDPLGTHHQKAFCASGWQSM